MKFLMTALISALLLAHVVPAQLRQASDQWRGYSGHYLLLVKKGKEWVVQKEFMARIS
jgi:hypothetical protein